MKRLAPVVRRVFPAVLEGQVHRVLGLTAESRGLFAPVGGSCEIHCRDGQHLEAEVVGFRQEHAIVAPYGDIRGISAGDRIVYRGRSACVRVGRGLIGRVVDSQGLPLVGGPIEEGLIDVPLHSAPRNPLQRSKVERVLVTGVRAIDGLATAGRGQRMGIFSGSGVGKSVLLGMIARNTDASVVVIGLIGERSREVREFVETNLGEKGLRRAVVVAATSEEAALRRIQAAKVATAVAEHFRDEGEDVLLLMDSLTRVATAQRELGLSCGEPPATKGYPPSVFALLPRLLERAGPTQRGSITGFYTVLVEADDPHDPIADCARSVLDGHLWLSREAAERGFFPAMDPLASLSRVQSSIVDEVHLASALAVKAHLSRYRQVEDLIRMGAYVPGADPIVDESVQLYPRIEAFLRQGKDESSSLELTVQGLRSLADETALVVPGETA
jgi:FliI/YscN family ATPase